MKRGKSETWRDFTGRWETPLRKAREHHIELREAYLVFLFIHGLGLSDGEIRNMLVFTQGEIKPKAVQSWLRKSETKLTVDKVGADGKETKKILLMESCRARRTRTRSSLWRRPSPTSRTIGHCGHCST